MRVMNVKSLGTAKGRLLFNAGVIAMPSEFVWSSVYPSGGDFTT
jgi:hypothetical protein